jgi:hypothetical protein
MRIFPLFIAVIPSVNDGVGAEMVHAVSACANEVQIGRGRVRLSGINGDCSVRSV